ncbi:anthranilate phosphoribosyltransferase [archaeon]|jgi:anthranilate phosphoribosyltransferase|nr:anthranilate phosphoribosyltransferase [archaeon]MBT4648522.1 anthranilate phosphoribosyltransferase [archaeon]MBT6821341.1 anthranilate phosphoribosyltransferase [archaeon]MBT7391976.1 anthranilate phosphoribosyltransferase [archaeon]
MIKNILKKLVEKENLDELETKYAFEKIMSGGLEESQVASFLTALQIKGATNEEIIFALNVIRSKAVMIDTDVKNMVDTCGTGGDNSGTFNISTAVSFVVAGAGVPVAKHGNRSASSKCGSADVLESLGVKLNISPQKNKNILEKIGICFMFAPIYHPSFKHVGKIRKELGFRTIFNFLGPLCNPANVKRQVIGVYDNSLSEKIAEVLKEIGTKHALIVNSDGMDEISNFSKTKITEIKDGEINTYNLDPENYGYSGSINEIKGGTPQENKQIILSILQGDKGPKRDIVVLNAAAAIYVSGIVDSIEEGIKLAEKSIETGNALQKLNQLIKETNEGETNENN